MKVVHEDEYRAGKWFRGTLSEYLRKEGNASDQVEEDQVMEDKSS